MSVHGLPEIKTENTGDVVVSTIVISEEDIDRSHRVWKFYSTKKKPRPVIVKFASQNV